MQGDGAANEGSASDVRRRKLLAELRRKLKRNNNETDTDDGTSDDDMLAPEKKSKSMCGNKLAVKLQRAIELGWLHEGQQVRKQTGGGTRKISVAKNADGKVIIEHGKKLFFPDGVSKRGIKLEDVDLALCDFSMNETSPSLTVGESYEKEKPSGILRWYLSTTWKASIKGNTKTLQLKPASAVAQKCKSESISSTHVQGSPPSDPPKLRTAQPTVKETTDLQIIVPDILSAPSAEHGVSPPTFPAQDIINPSEDLDDYGFPMNRLFPVLKGEVCLSCEPLDISYFKDVESVYSGNISRVTANSRSQCIYSATDDDGNPIDPDVVYDPLQNGYQVAEISKGNRSFVTCKSSLAPNSDSEGPGVLIYEFPSKTTAESSDPYLILHHPDEVWGFEEGKLILAVVSQNHNADVCFQWFCDNQPIHCGGCLLQVDKPGSYNCVVKTFIQQDGGERQEITMLSNTVQVVKISGSSTAVKPVGTKKSGLQKIEASDISCDFQKAINHGSFGEVFRGKFKEVVVAVKRIKLTRGKRPEKLLLKEANIHQQIEHKNIVKFMGAYMDPCYVFIVTEFVEGQNMEDMIYLHDDQVDMPHKKASVAVGVLEGVAYLHEHDPQIIHQDIKPANILLDKYLNPKLCDLGLAKVRSFGVASTTTGVFSAGTPEYMSPETLLENKKSSAASDMWSVGLTLIEWFSGRDPWDLQDQEEEPVMYIRNCMRKQEVPPVLKMNKFPLLLPCLKYDPTDRPSARILLRQFQCPSCSNTMLK